MNMNDKMTLWCKRQLKKRGIPITDATMEMARKGVEEALKACLDHSEKELEAAGGITLTPVKM